MPDHELGQVLQLSAVYIYEFPQILNQHMMPNTPLPSLLLCPQRKDEMVVSIHTARAAVGINFNYGTKKIFL